MSLSDAFADLVFGSSCVGCGQPGRVWCSACDATYTLDPFDSSPVPCPDGLASPVAVAKYGAGIRDLIVGHKEHRRLTHGAALAPMLARAAAAHSHPWPVVLVPVPSRPAAVRARGHDPTWTLTRLAARQLRATGTQVTSARLLRTRPGLADQAGLSAAARAANLEHSLACSTRRLKRLRLRFPEAVMVVCDDVITTGASAREAQRALESVGLVVIGVASVAAVERRV